MADERKDPHNVFVVHPLGTEVGTGDPEEFLRFAPQEWAAQYRKAAHAPFQGPMRDVHGVVHEIFGNFTGCGKVWAGETRFGHIQHNKGWTTPAVGTAYTCFACLRDIHLPGD